MSTNSNNNKLFIACCLSLVVTAMTFAIRAGILNQLGIEFDLTDTQLGWVNSMAFWGFPVATMVGGLIYNLIGAKRLVILAFVCHLLGLGLTITAGGFWGLLISTFLIGFANGLVEAGCNPLIADIYHDNQTTMLNKFHVWFPGGLAIGSLISLGMTNMELGWQLQIAVILIPTLAYAFLIFTSDFPETENVETSTATNIKSLLSPLYLFMVVCMTLTATSELGTQQWIEKILAGASGVHPMLILAMITTLMALGRYFAGPIVHRLNPTGVLWMSSIIATIGIYSMSVASGGMVYLAAILFAIGVCYFWPTMIGFISEYCPKTGPLGMSLIGGAGMFATGIWQPVIGSWLDGERANAIASGLDSAAADLAAGKATLDNLALFPAVLIIAFGILHFNRKKLIGDKA